MPLSLRDLFKPVFRSETTDVLLHKTQHAIDRMRGFIRADEPESFNQYHQGSRHLANAMEALRRIVVDHKKTSLFGFAWKYINFWPAIKHAFFHKNEPLNSDIINDQAMLRTLTPFFQEMVLSRLWFTEKQDLDFIAQNSALIRRSVKTALMKCTFQQLSNLQEDPLKFFNELFIQTNKIVHEKLQKQGHKRGWLWNNNKHLETAVFEAGAESIAVAMAGVNALRTLLSGIQKDIFTHHVKNVGSVEDVIVNKARELSDKLSHINVSDGRATKPSPTDAFREIVLAECPRTLQRKLPRVVVFNQQAVRQLHELHDARVDDIVERVDDIVERVRSEMGVEPEVRRAFSYW